MNEEALKKLYDSGLKYYELPSFDEFKENMQNKESALMFKQSMSKYYQMPGDEQFLSDIRIQDVKKKDTTASPDQSLDSTSVQDSSDIKKKLSEEDYDKGDFEFDDRFSAGANDVMASISRIPAFINEQVATVIGAFDSDFRDQLDSMTREERDLFLGNMPIGIGSSTGAITKVSEEYTKEAEKIRSSFDTFDKSITEDISAGNLGQAAGRLFNEAVGALPSMIQAFIPGVGIASIGLGSAAQKSKELQDKGYDLGLKTSANSIISGTAEGLADLVTKRIGGRFFNSLAGKGKDYVVKSVGNFAKSFGIDFAEEGASETFSLFVSKLADYRISGDKEAFNNTLYEFTDTFLVGGFATGPLSGGKIGIDIARQNSRKRNVNKKVEASKYESISDAFSEKNMDEVDSNQTDIAKSKGAKEILKFDLEEKVNKKTITREDADKRLESFDEVFRLSKETEGLNLTSEKNQQATNLIREKRKLEKIIEGKDENLVAPQKKRIDEINEQLSKVQQEQVVEEVAELETETETETRDQLELLNEDKTPFERPEGSELYIIGKRQKTVALVDSAGKFLGAFDSKTGEKRKTTESSEAELIDQLNYDKGESALEGLDGEVKDPNQLIADRSQNPKEVAQAYIEEKNKRPEEKSEEGGSQLLLDLRENNQKFSLKSLLALKGNIKELFPGKKINELSDKELRKAKIDLNKNYPGILKWVAKEDKNNNIEDVSRDDYGVEPNDIFEAIKDKTPVPNKVSVIQANLKELFKELTGLKGTDSQIEKVAEQDPSSLKPINEPIEITEEQAAKQEELEIEDKLEQAEEKAKAEKQAAIEPKTEGIAGRISDAFKKAKSFLKKQATIHFTAQGLQPDIIYKERQNRDANIRMYQNRIDRMRKDINSALRKIPKDKRDSVMKEFDQVFRGKLDPNKSTLSDDLLAIAGRMRGEIDGLSNMIIESGYFDTKEGLEAVEKNIGSYVNRSYRLFTNSNWPNKVSEEVKENARRFLRRQFIQEGRTVSEQEIEIQINEILNKAEDNKYIVKGKDGRIDKDILRRRKDVPAELRALMGEVTNPLENYLNTVSKQAMLLFNYKFQRKIAESGSNTFFTKSPTKENTVQIVKEGNEAYPELAGLWTTPEIAKTFEMPSAINGHYDAFVKFSSAIKWGKTVGSIATHAKNILGNHGFVLMNGHLDWNEFKNAADLAIKEFRGKTTEEQRAYLDQLISLGIVKQSTTLGDITTMYGDSSFEEAYKRTVIDQSRNLASRKQKISDTFKSSRAGKVTRNVVDTLNDLYQSEDDFFKIMAYGIEKQRYSKAKFGKDKADLTKAESDQINEIVSEIVKNTYPTYDRVPPIVKRLGRSPFLGAFVSFQAESIRTAYNTYKIALKEVNSDNKEVSKIGAKRLASAGLYTGLKLALATQLGLAAKSLIFGGEDDESEEYNDLRKFVAPWSQDSLIAITSKGIGKYTFIDLTANDPHSFLSELIIAGRDDNESTPLLIEKLKALAEPFLGKDLVFSFASDSYLIYEDQKLSSDEKSDKIISEFFKLIQPGTITSAVRLKESALGGKNKFENEIAGFTGYRPVEVDIEKSYLFRVIDFQNKKSTIIKTYNRIRYNKESTKEDLVEAYNKVNEDYSQVIKEAHELTKSAFRLGVSGNAMDKILSGKFNKRDRSFIFSGKDYFYVPTEMRK